MVLEAARRTMGMFLVVLSAIFLGYLVLGPYLPGMLIMGFTALFSAFFSILAVIVISALRRDTRMNLRDIYEALVLGARNTISTAIACAAVGFIVGSVGLSGIGLLFTQSILGVADGHLLIALLLAAAASLFLSFGLPTTSVYIITATLVAPSLVQMGVAPLVASSCSSCMPENAGRRRREFLEYGTMRP